MKLLQLNPQTLVWVTNSWPQKLDKQLTDQAMSWRLFQAHEVSGRNGETLYGSQYLCLQFLSYGI